MHGHECAGSQGTFKAEFRFQLTRSKQVASLLSCYMNTHVTLPNQWYSLAAGKYILVGTCARRQDMGPQERPLSIQAYFCLQHNRSWNNLYVAKAS
jgi:hypothetical protein